MDPAGLTCRLGVEQSVRRQVDPEGRGTDTGSAGGSLGTDLPNGAANGFWGFGTRAVAGTRDCEIGSAASSSVLESVSEEEVVEANDEVCLCGDSVGRG